MAKPIEFLPAALEEFEIDAHWYRERDPRLARSFAEELQRALNLIAAAPRRWPESRSGTRRINLWKFPYTVVYRDEPNRVVIVAVARYKKKPGYWRARAKGGRPPLGR